MHEYEWSFAWYVECEFASEVTVYHNDLGVHVLFLLIPEVWYSITKNVLLV